MTKTNRCKICKKEIAWAFELSNPPKLCFACRQHKEGKGKFGFYN